MVKVPTGWSGNASAQANRVGYSSATTKYNSSVVTYSSIVIGDQSDTEKTAIAWAKADKTPTAWADDAAKSPIVWSES